MARMYDSAEIWNQCINYGLSANIKYLESEACILYGIRIENVKGRHEFFSTYRSDFYEPLPKHLTNTILSNGWRKGVCILMVERMENFIEKNEDYIKKERSAENPDLIKIERFEVTIANAKAKKSKYENQL